MNHLEFSLPFARGTGSVTFDFVNRSLVPSWWFSDSGFLLASGHWRVSKRKDRFQRMLLPFVPSSSSSSLHLPTTRCRFSYFFFFFVAFLLLLLFVFDVSQPCMQPPLPSVDLPLDNLFLIKDQRHLRHRVPWETHRAGSFAIALWEGILFTDDRFLEPC